MLKDSTDFDYTIDLLNEELDLNIQLQDDTMDSNKMNKSFESIEYNLNKLYEKTRYLEDIIDYAKTFLTIKIDNYCNDINSSIKSIEDISKIDKNLGYIDYNVPFVKNTIDIKDRNKNYKITPCAIKNNVLTLSNRISDSYEYLSAIMKCEQKPHINNISSIKEDGFYRSIYLEEKPVNNGILETFTVYLDEPREVNELNIKPVNCKIKNIRYVYINGIEEQAGDLVTGIELESRMVTHIKFDIECTNYSTIQYVLDKDKITSNVLNNIKEFEYPSSNNSEDKVSYEAIIKKIEYNSLTNESNIIAYRKDVENTQSIIMYAYNFGFDTFEINRNVLYEDNYFLSEPISLGTFNENEYLQLYIEDNNSNNSSIEYYIVDGDIDVPINPIGSNYIYNERIFPETDLRFIMSDKIESYNEEIIKKDGLELPISLDEVKLKYDARYSISYTPLTENTYTPLNNTVRVKAIIRTFGDNHDTIPYINNINIRKFGGNSLWTNLY